MGDLLKSRYFHQSTKCLQKLYYPHGDEVRDLDGQDPIPFLVRKTPVYTMSHEEQNQTHMTNLSNEAFVMGNPAVGSTGKAMKDNAGRSPEGTRQFSPAIGKDDIARGAASLLSRPLAMGAAAAEEIKPTSALAELAIKEVEKAFHQAERSVRPYLLNRELKVARAELAKAADSEMAKSRVSKILAELSKCGPAKYAQTTKLIYAYAAAVQKYAVCEPDSTKRESMMVDSIKKLESQLHGPDNLFKGIPGKSPDLPKLYDSTLSPPDRLNEVMKHLLDKIEKMDGDQLARIRKVEQQRVFSNLILRCGAIATETKGDAIFVFDDSGHLIRGIELLSEEAPDLSDLSKFDCHAGTAAGAIAVKTVRTEDGTPVILPERQGMVFEHVIHARLISAVSGKVPEFIEAGQPFDIANDAFAVFFRIDGSMVLDGNTNLPKPVDIVRLRRSGISPEGGGFHRFIDEEIIGMAIVMKKCNAAGIPIQIKGTDGTIAKEVVEVVGVVPNKTVDTADGAIQVPLVKVGTSYGNLLKIFREKIRQKPSDPKN